MHSFKSDPLIKLTVATQFSITRSCDPITPTPSASHLRPTPPPDHFVLLTTAPAADFASAANITIVPTNPHPGPVAGHLALNGTDASAPSSSASPPPSPDFAYNLIQTWHPESELGAVHLAAWSSARTDDGREWLRYDGEGLANGRWVAVKGKTPFFGVEMWSPWWIGKGAEGAGRLAGKEWVEIELEIVDAQKGVLSRREMKMQRRMRRHVKYPVWFCLMFTLCAFSTTHCSQ